MHLFRQTLKGAGFLSGAEIANQACSFARNIILARFLTKADFGVAALLAMVLTLFEMTSKMALGQLVVQSKRGEDRAFVDSVQFAQVSVGLGSAAMLVIFAWPISHFFAGAHYFASILALALIPLVNGLSNLDLYRRARQLGFGRLVLADMIPNLIVTLAAWPLAVYFRDYRAVVCLLLARAILSSTLSQFLAERPFHPRLERASLRESLAFGWPLLLSGLIQFGNFQGDSMVVAAGYPLAKLGEFSVALTMAMTPAFALMRVCQSLILPVLSEVQDDLSHLTRRYQKYVDLTALLACTATLGMLFCGEPVVVLFFGAKYAGVGILASWLIAAQGLRISSLKAASAMAAKVNGPWLLAG